MSRARYRRRRAAAVSTSGSAHPRSRGSASLPAIFSRARSQLDSSSHFDEPFLASDRRAWIPEPALSDRGVRLAHFQTGYSPVKRISGAPARVIAPPIPKRSKARFSAPPTYNAGALLFQAPGRVVVCVQRRVRKEVLHANGISGSRVRRGRRTADSRISCGR